MLWQLETDHRQHLPHLGAAIESVVVSPFGSSYAIRLADNSAMILSTSELQPTFSIAGIQVPTSQKVRTVLPFVPTVGATTSESKSKQGLRCPACVSSLGPNRLLLAVPPSATSRQPSNTPSNASYLQTFDVGASHQISRQALTRTKITTLNMGPESNIIEEPNVIIVQTSADGQWLATVDEWMPPERDLEPLSFSQARISEEQVFRQEIYLKFWSWNPDSKLWELVSRIDDPHSAPSGNPYDQSRVLALTADPTAVGFATIGEDGIVKTWKPVNRRRNGLEVRSKDGKSLTAWHYQLKIPLESLSEPLKDDSPSGAKLAYSQDGSILVAGFQSSSSCPVYLIDTISGDVQSVQTGIYTGPLLGLGIIHKYLVTLSNELCVWDLVNDKLHYGIDLSAHRLPLETQLASSHFAVDPQQLLFAIALPHNTPRGLGSQVAIFDPADERPLFLTGITASITALVPATGRKGFHVIDSAAEVRTVSPSQAKPWVPIALPKDRAAPSRGLKEIFGNGESALLSKDETDKDAELQISKLGNVTREPPIKATDDAVVVNSDRLAEIFDVGPAYALPPVTQLFEQVASLCSRPINT